MITKRKMQELFEKELDKNFPDSKPHRIIILGNNQNNLKRIIKNMDSDFDKLRMEFISLKNRIK